MDKMTPASFLVESGRAVTEVAHKEAPMQYQAKPPSAPRPSNYGFTLMSLSRNSIAWQVCSVGVVGLIFLVSSLYSNVISTVSLAVTPIAAVIVFHDKMNGVKIISMLLALWGFASYIYQNYLDDSKARHAQAVAKSHNDSPC